MWFTSYAWDKNLPATVYLEERSEVVGGSGGFDLMLFFLYVLFQVHTKKKEKPLLRFTMAVTKKYLFSLPKTELRKRDGCLLAVVGVRREGWHSCLYPDYLSFSG